MVNYYKQFDSFKQKYNFGVGGKMLLDTFQAKFMEFFGFSKKTSEKWMANFEDVGYIKITRDYDTSIWYVEMR
jgi:hypothetical protein